MTTPELITRIAREYGLEPLAVAERQSGYRNHSYRITPTSGEPVNLIVYKREPGILERIRRANFVSDTLAVHGLPTRRTLGPITQLKNDHYLRYTALYTYLPGATIPWEAYTRRHLKLLGAALSHLHAELADLTPPSDFPEAAIDYLEITAHMVRYFDDPAVQAAVGAKLGLTIQPKLFAHFTGLLNLCRRIPRQQILHLDFVRSNILFRQTPAGPEISGILDFEKTAVGHPVFDIARTLAFLLVDSKYKTEAQVRKYFLVAGYNKRGPKPFSAPIIRGRLNLLDELINLFLFHDFYKFLRHNPYEFLPQNEHFVRTRDLLQARGLLQSGAPVAPTGAKPVL
ncbi:MAG TPA: phosphotransferase [Candidatus Saccharimonadia bacterium]|jgi:Ser/Thr protein kinase RdoA (MazF antagonist)